MAANEAKPNPFSSPVADASERVGELAENGPHATLGKIAKRVFLDWEKLRLLYNGMLAAVTLWLGWSQVNTLEFWGVALVGGLISNACYFIGPIIETYVTWLGFRATRLRWFCFVLGTLFTMVAAAAAMFSLAMPTQ